MKKIYVILAVVALLSFTACGNKKAQEANEAAEPAKTEVTEEKTAQDEVKDAVTEAAVDVAKTGIAAGAEAIKDEIKK